MKVVRLNGIDWLLSMNSLSIGAFYLLNVLYRKDMDISDTTMMEATGYGTSTHRKHKKELIDTGYLLLEQIGRGEYRYTLKDTNGH